MSRTGPPTSTGPNPSLDILAPVETGNQLAEGNEGKRPLRGKNRDKKKYLKGPKRKKYMYFSARYDI